MDNGERLAGSVIIGAIALLLLLLGYGLYQLFGVFFVYALLAAVLFTAAVFALDRWSESRK